MIGNSVVLPGEVTPAQNGPFWLAMRIYWPKSEALDGTWKQPPLLRAE
jgi:hypothetical protein